MKRPYTIVIEYLTLQAKLPCPSSEARTFAYIHVHCFTTRPDDVWRIFDCSKHKPLSESKVFYHIPDMKSTCVARAHPARHPGDWGLDKAVSSDIRTPVRVPLLFAQFVYYHLTFCWRKATGEFVKIMSLLFYTCTREQTYGTVLLASDHLGDNTFVFE